MPAPTPQPSPVLGDHEVVRRIATGGMGSVFEVRDRRTGAHRAAKTILKAGDATARARFRQEAELLARCDRHPGVVKVHATGETTDGTPYMILDLVPGEDLEARLARGRLPTREAAAIARDVARALGFLHERGILHRDVKPSNVILDASANGAPRLTDFGLATARDLERLTRSGQFLGTPFYCSPEQAVGRDVGPAADVYSLGCVLFQALAGEAPIPAASALELLGKLGEDEPVRDVREVAPEVPAPLAAVVARALEKSAARRYPGGAELAADLERFLSGETVHADAAQARARSRRRVVLGASAGVVLAVATLALALVVARRRARDRELAAVAARSERARAVLERARHDGAAAVTSADLAVLDAAPGGVAGLAPEDRLLRARVLLALDRAPDAAREAEALRTLAPAREGEAAELAGDAWLACGHGRESAAAFEAALRLGRRGTDLRARHAAAAERAGDDAAVAAELAALAPALASLSTSREANARLAPLAPVLYRRALATKDRDARERELETAWRVGPPPAASACDVARIWAARAGDDTQATAEITGGRMLDRAGIAQLRRVLELMKRAVDLDPSSDASALWSRLAILRLWADAGTDETELERAGTELATAWPGHPSVLYLLARARLKSRPRDGHALLLEAARTLETFPEHEEARLLAAGTADALIRLYESERGPAWADLPALVRVSLRSASVLIATRAVEACRQLGRADLARSIVDAVPTFPGLRWTETERRDYALSQLTVLCAERRIDEALSLALSQETLRPNLLMASGFVLELIQAGRMEDVVRVVEASRGRGPVTVDVESALHNALLVLDRSADARAVEARVEKASPEHAAKLRGLRFSAEWDRVRRSIGAGDAAAIGSVLPRARAVHAEAGSETSLRWLVRALAAHGALGRKESQAELARLVDPAATSDPEVLEAAGAAWVALGSVDEAEAFGKRAEAGSPEAAAAVKIRVLAQRHQFEDALAAARELHARAPSSRTLDLLLGELHRTRRREGTHPRVEVEIVSLCEAAPELSPDARSIYGEALATRGRFEDAAKEVAALESAGLAAKGAALRLTVLEAAKYMVGWQLADEDAAGALVIARTVHATSLVGRETTALLARVLREEAHAPAEVVALVDPARVEDEGTLLDLGLALAALGRAGEAKAISARLRDRAPDVAGRIEVRVLLAAGDKVGALTRARACARESRGPVALAAVLDALEASGRRAEIPAAVGEGVLDPAVLFRAGSAALAEGRTEEAFAFLGRLDGVSREGARRLKKRIEAVASGRATGGK